MARKNLIDQAIALKAHKDRKEMLKLQRELVAAQKKKNNNEDAPKVMIMDTEFTGGEIILAAILFPIIIIGAALEAWQWLVSLF